MPKANSKMTKKHSDTSSSSKSSIPAFSVTDELYEIFGTELPNSGKDSDQSLDKLECTHENNVVTNDDGSRLCTDCGCKLEDMLTFEPEWRYFDGVAVKDPSRCHKSKESTKGGIEKVFQEAKLSHIPESIKRKTEQKCKIMFDGATFRGQARKLRVAAALFHVFWDEGDMRTSDEVRHMFGLSKQKMSDGLTAYYVKFPEERNRRLKPVDLLLRIMKKTGVTRDYYKVVKKILEQIDGIDPVINRSSPQSVAAAVLYLYLHYAQPKYKKELGLTKSKFSTSASLSDITISKLAKRAAHILNVQTVI